MILTTDEIEQAAQRLFRGVQPNDRWETSGENVQNGYRQIVEGLAAKLVDVPHTETTVRMFMLWMGDE